MKTFWPTLEGRLRHPLTSRVEAIRQLQTMIPISSTAKAVLERSKVASCNGRGPTAGFGR